MTMDEMLAEVRADTTGYVGPPIRIAPTGTLTVTPVETVGIEGWSGEYRVLRRDGGRVYVAGPGLVASVPASHIRSIGRTQP